MTAKSNRKFFLFSFIPAVAYWYLEANYSLKIAVFGGILLSFLELFLEWIFTRELHTLSKLNCVLMVVLGGFSLLGESGVFFKLQPALSGYAVALFLVFKLKKGDGLLSEMIKEMKTPEAMRSSYRLFERDLVFFLLIYSTIIVFFAIYGTTAQWVFCKTIGLYISFIPFIIYEVLMMRRRMKLIIKSAEHLRF